MAREIRLNAFVMNCAGHQSPGLWAHPRDRSAHYTDIDYWTGLARKLEAGLFDGVFLADVLGVYDVFGGTPDAALRAGIQVPVNDPLMVIPAMAAVTRDIGFGVTSLTSYEPPYLFARRMSTLDHLTKGRIAWNIVTGYLDSAAKGMGQDVQMTHEDRYAQAEEYLEVVYALWEGSWEDGAVLHDRERRIFTDPAKVHRVRHDGKHYKVDAIHLCEPSPQRTPVLYQAGQSGVGKAFAARHAECVFTASHSWRNVKGHVSDIRTQAAANGRNPADISIFTLLTLIPGRTEDEARAKYEDYRQYVSTEGSLALVSGWTGIDLSAFDPDEPITSTTNNAIVSVAEALTRAGHGDVWTVRRIAGWAGVGGLAPVVCGTPAQIADELERWVADTDVDGFNLAYALSPETFEDIVDLVVPELQRRGRYKTAYAPGVLREKLQGPGRRLTAPDHPAARFRPAGRAEAAQ